MEHAIVILWLLGCLACTLPFGRYTNPRGLIGTGALALLFSFLAWLSFGFFVGILKEGLGLRLFVGGDNDLIFLNYFFIFPLLAAIGIRRGALQRGLASTNSDQRERK
jgi:hypothetical protein